MCFSLEYQREIARYGTLGVYISFGLFLDLTAHEIDNFACTDNDVECWLSVHSNNRNQKLRNECVIKIREEYAGGLLS